MLINGTFLGQFASMLLPQAPELHISGPFWGGEGDRNGEGQKQQNTRNEK